MSELVLVTIGVSHYCEKARWALDRAGLEYREEAHAPVLHWAAALRHGTRRTLPALLTGTEKVLDSTDILGWVDRHAGEGLRLYPEEPGARAEVEALEDWFDERLGPATRRFAYSSLLGDRPIMVDLMATGCSPGEAAALRWAAPLVVATLVRGLRLSPESGDRALERTAKIFEDVAAKLGARRFLVGDAFTAADLTFAALAAPMVLPEGHPLAASLGALPPAMRAAVDAMRRTPAGAFVERLYREHRPPARL